MFYLVEPSCLFTIAPEEAGTYLRSFTVWFGIRKLPDAGRDNQVADVVKQALPFP